MTKNKTRKGLALLSTFALTFAGLVGFAAPAQANTVLLAPSVGTEYAVPLGETFILETRYATGSNGFAEGLTVTVVDTDEALASVGVSANADGSSPTSIARGTGTDSDTFEDTVSDPGVGAKRYIVLTPSGTATFSVTVSTGFEAGSKSPERTVTFHKAADYTWNLSFTTPVVGDAKLGAVVSTTPQLNLAQVASGLKVGFATVASNGNLTAATAATTVSTPDFTSGTAATVTADVTRATSGTYTWAVSALAPVDSANTYAAQIIFGTDEVGTRQVIKPAADTIVKLVTPALAASVDTKDALIRVGATSATVETVAYKAYTDADTNTVTPAGETVTVTISKGAQFDAKASVAAGGKTLTATTTDGEIEITATVGAEGKVSIPLTLSGLKASDKFSVAVAAQNADAVAGALTTEFTATATAAAQMVDHNLIGADAKWKVTHGTYTIRFAVLDNFDQLLAGTGYRVVLDNATSGDEVAGNVVNGVATFTVSTKDSADDAVTSFSAQLQKADGLSFVDSGTPVTLPVAIGASTAAGTVAVDGANTANKFVLAGPYALNLKDMKAANTRLGEAAPTIGTLGHTLAGDITDANGVGTYGNVTVSAAGLMFAATTPGSKKVFSMDSITVQTNTIGEFGGVEVYSNTAGKVDVTVSSGSASQVVTLTFAAAGVSTGTALVVDAPASVVPGSTLVVKATLADKYGNAVSPTSDVVVSYEGPGLPLTTPTAFVDGALQFGVLLGTNDSGTATVTVSVYTLLDKITVQKTIVIGTAGNVGALASWTSNQNDGTVKMYAKNVVGAGKVQFMVNGVEIAWVRAASTSDSKLRLAGAEGAAYLVRTVDLVEGQKNVLEIYVDGVRTTRTAYTY